MSADSRDGASTPLAARPVRVVVADDDHDIRLLLQLVMQGRNDVQLVGEAADGAQAIELVAALRPDLLVLDIQMPVLDGLTALPRLREVSPDTRVVMLSALSTVELRALAASVGAAAYVQKGVAVSALLDELLRAAHLLDAVLDTLLPSETHRDLPQDVAGPGRARRFVSETLTSWGEAELLSTVELLVSELVTNVVVHTTAAPEVSVRLLGDLVHVEVADTDPTLPLPRHAGDVATNGRGMALVDALATTWGWTPTAGGKVVWFDVARPPSPPQGPAGQLLTRSTLTIADSDFPSTCSTTTR